MHLPVNGRLRIFIWIESLAQMVLQFDLALLVCEDQLGESYEAMQRMEHVETAKC